MAVFGPNEEAAFATDAMLSMQECWPEIRKRVTFHLVYPTEHPADLTTSKGMLQIISSNIRNRNMDYKYYKIACKSFSRNIGLSLEQTKDRLNMNLVMIY